MKKTGKFIAGILAMLMLMATLCSCSSGSSRSGKKWSDLSETEKNNARWAYEVQESIKKQK